jgi:hypothetical protein
MGKNKLYTILNDTEGRAVLVEPSEYLRKLHPHLAIAELKDHIASLDTTLRQCFAGDLETPDDFQKTRRLLYELEIARKFFVRVKETYTASRGKYALR